MAAARRKARHILASVTQGTNPAEDATEARRTDDVRSLYRKFEREVVHRFPPKTQLNWNGSMPPPGAAPPCARAPLDSERALAVMHILNQMASRYQTAIVVTHDEKIIPTFKRIHSIRDGRTVEEAGEG